LEYEDVHAGEITSLIQNEHIYNYDTDDDADNDNDNNEEQPEEENAILGIINENGILDLVNYNETVNDSDAESDEEVFVNNTEDEIPDDDSVS
jgi:hypothetical protein